MKYSYVVYKLNSFSPEDRGIRLGVIVQGNDAVKVKFNDSFKELLNDYDSKYDRYVLDNLPQTLDDICSSETFTVSSSEGGEIATTDPRFLDELRKLYRSRIQISTPKIVETSDTELDKVAETVGV